MQTCIVHLIRHSLAYALQHAAVVEGAQAAGVGAEGGLPAPGESSKSLSRRCDWVCGLPIRRLVGVSPRAIVQLCTKILFFKYKNT